MDNHRDIDRLLGEYPVFFRKVWKATIDILPGHTRTYQDIAKIIGNPKAARAVGMALSKNPLPGIIPCHRVIRKDGTIGGFSQGVNRKRSMLEEEKKYVVKF